MARAKGNGHGQSLARPRDCQNAAADMAADVTHACAAEAAVVSPPPPFVRCSHGVMGWRGLLVGGRGPRRGAARLGRAPWLLRANHNDDQALHNRHRQCLAANLGSATLAGGTFKGLRAVYGHVSAFCGYLAAGRLLVDLPPTAHMAPKRREKIQGAVAGGSICRWIWGHRDQRR
jgi:hypothetical protein